MTPSTHSQEGPSEITPRPDLLAGIPDRLDLDQLGAVARHPSIGRAVSSARELLQMDLAYVTEFVGNDQILRVPAGRHVLPAPARRPAREPGGGRQGTGGVTHHADHRSLERRRVHLGARGAHRRALLRNPVLRRPSAPGRPRQPRGTDSLPARADDRRPVERDELQSEPSTSAGTAAYIPTGCPAGPSRWPAGWSSCATPTTR